MEVSWQATDGDVRMPLAEAEWWRASLALLVAVFCQPPLLADRDEDAATVARDVREELDELLRAACCAAAQRAADPDPAQRAGVRREGDEIVYSPGDEVASLAWCLEVFACGVLDPEGPEAGIARGAAAHAVAASSRDIAKASGALSVPDLRGPTTRDSRGGAR